LQKKSKELKLDTQKTLNQYNEVAKSCRDLFVKKNKDYGTSWRILRPASITDQLLIKAQRIRSIEEKGSSQIAEPIEDEFIGIVNYCIIGLIQLAFYSKPGEKLDENRLMSLYDQEMNATRDLMLKKNHDYGEAWRLMRPPTFTDLILTKIYRTREIENNKGMTLVSEGIDANYRDMMNYAIFAIIRINENKI
jgi:hypothetical protein